MADADETGLDQAPAGRRAIRRRRVPGGRPVQCKVRFTAEEAERVTAAAAAAGVTVPHLVAQTVLLSLERPGSGLSAGDRRVLAHELGKIRGFLASIGRNVNQLAAAANSGNAPASGVVEATMHAVAARMADLDKALERLNGGRR